MKTAFLAVAAGLTAVIVFALVSAGAGKPDWKIGRAVIAERTDHNGRKEAFVKLSIRNQRSGGTEQVAIYGRWARDRDRSGTGRRSRMGRGVPPSNRTAGRGRQGPLRGFFRLGLFTREVARKQTAIIEVSLRPLGSIIRNVRFVELVVLSGHAETDRRFIPVSDTFSR